MHLAKVSLPARHLVLSGRQQCVTRSGSLFQWLLTFAIKNSCLISNLHVYSLQLPTTEALHLDILELFSSLHCFPLINSYHVLKQSFLGSPWMMHAVGLVSRRGAEPIGGNRRLVHARCSLARDKSSVSKLIFSCFQVNY